MVGGKVAYKLPNRLARAKGSRAVSEESGDASGSGKAAIRFTPVSRLPTFSPFPNAESGCRAAVERMAPHIGASLDQPIRWSDKNDGQQTPIGNA